jgi:hypothetical protein
VLAVWAVERRRRLMPAALGILMGSVASIVPFHWQDFKDNRKFLSSAQETIRKDKPALSELGTLFSDAGTVRDSVAVMRKHALAPVQRKT